MAGTDRPRVKRILYFADPMCSWCWGFSPVIGELARACGDRVPIRLCVGGLRAGETRAMDDRARAFVRHHWEQVQACTGQPFAYAFFTREALVYDTEPACRAAVTVRSLAPEATLGYLAAIQHDFYADNRDVTREDVLAEVAAALGLARDDFIAAYRAPEVVEAARADFALTQALGICRLPHRTSPERRAADGFERRLSILRRAGARPARLARGVIVQAR